MSKVFKIEDLLKAQEKPDIIFNEKVDFFGTMLTARFGPCVECYFHDKVICDSCICGNLHYPDVIFVEEGGSNE